MPDPAATIADAQRCADLWAAVIRQARRCLGDGVATPRSVRQRRSRWERVLRHRAPHAFMGTSTGVRVVDT